MTLETITHSGSHQPTHSRTHTHTHTHTQRTNLRTTSHGSKYLLCCHGRVSNHLDDRIKTYSRDILYRQQPSVSTPQVPAHLRSVTWEVVFVGRRQKTNPTGGGGVHTASPPGEVQTQTSPSEGHLWSKLTEAHVTLISFKDY